MVVRVDDTEGVDVLARGKHCASTRYLAPPEPTSTSWAPAGANELWLIRTYERGVEGETLACGTGTVAAALALAQQGEAGLPTVLSEQGRPQLTVRGRLGGGRASDVWLAARTAGVPRSVGGL